MIPRKITIERCENGYLLTWLEELDDGKFAVRKDTVSEREFSDLTEEDIDAKVMQNVLWEVMEHFWVYKGLRVFTEKELEEELTENTKYAIKEYKRKQRKRSKR